MRGRGLAARFIYAMPESTVGSRCIDPRPVPRHLAEAWDRLLRRVFDLAESGQLPTLHLSPEAEARLRTFAEELEPRLHAETGDLGPIADWGSKLTGNAARIAGLIHLADEKATTGLVDTGAVEAAIAIADWAVPHAQAALGALGLDPEVSRVKTLLNWIQRNGQTSFTKREAYRGLQSLTFPEPKSLDEPITVLEAHHWIRRVRQHERSRGRPSEVWEVNPLAIGEPIDPAGG